MNRFSFAALTILLVALATSEALSGSTFSRDLGITVPTDQVGQVEYPVTKLVVGASGTAQPITSASPLPVAVISGGGGGTVNQGSSGSQAWPVSIASPLPAGTNAIGKVELSGSTAADIANLSGSTASINSKTPALGPNSSASSVPVVLASDHGPIAVTGSFGLSTADSDSLSSTSAAVQALSSGSTDGSWKSQLVHSSAGEVPGQDGLSAPVNLPQIPLGGIFLNSGSFPSGPPFDDYHYSVLRMTAGHAAYVHIDSAGSGQQASSSSLSVVLASDHGIITVSGTVDLATTDRDNLSSANSALQSLSSGSTDGSWKVQLSGSTATDIANLSGSTAAMSSSVATETTLSNLSGSTASLSSAVSALSSASNSHFAKTASYSQSDTYSSGSSAGAWIDMTAAPAKYFSIQVTSSGSVTSWDVRLECSLTGTGAGTPIITHTQAADDQVLFPTTAGERPCRYIRSRPDSVVESSGSVSARIVGVQ